MTEVMTDVSVETGRVPSLVLAVLVNGQHGVDGDPGSSTEHGIRIARTLWQAELSRLLQCGRDIPPDMRTEAIEAMEALGWINPADDEGSTSVLQRAWLLGEQLYRFGLQPTNEASLPDEGTPIEMMPEDVVLDARGIRELLAIYMGINTDMPNDLRVTVEFTIDGLTDDKSSLARRRDGMFLLQVIGELRQMDSLTSEVR